MNLNFRRPEPKMWKIPAAAFAYLLYGIIAGLVVVAFVGANEMISRSVVRPDNIGIPVNAVVVPLVGPLLEEAFFRLIPLALAIRIASDTVVLRVLFIQAFVFGLLHGNWYNIFIQGVLGLLLGYTFLRFALGGTKHPSEAKLLRGYAASSAVHIIINTIVFVIALAANQTLQPR